MEKKRNSACEQLTKKETWIIFGVTALVSGACGVGVNVLCHFTSCCKAFSLTAATSGGSNVVCTPIIKGIASRVTAKEPAEEAGYTGMPK